MTQGIIDSVIFNQESNRLLIQAGNFRNEIRALKNDISDDVTNVTATTELLHFTEKRGMIPNFTEELFEKYVKRIVVCSRQEICFELKCGLALKERM